MGNWTKAAIVAGLLAAGTGLGWAGKWATSKPTDPGSTTVIQPGDSQRLGIEVIEGGAIDNTK
jgi:hypothetical protein